jgi:hypothetical protein
MNTEKRLVIIGPYNQGDGVYYLVDPATNEVLYGHYCSHIGFAKGDLYTGRPERWPETEAKYGKVDIDFATDAERAAFKRHCEQLNEAQ